MTVGGIPFEKSTNYSAVDDIWPVYTIPGDPDFFLAHATFKNPPSYLQYRILPSFPWMVSDTSLLTPGRNGENYIIFTALLNFCRIYCCLGGSFYFGLGGDVPCPRLAKKRYPANPPDIEVICSDSKLFGLQKKSWF